MSSAVGHFFAADLQRCNQQKDKLRGRLRFAETFDILNFRLVKGMVRE
ncbi:MAG: hypothetical protein KHX22_08410 [Clostridiales bacterium]|jgi:hypothetical protein|nr:hypothetical protein [Clostridiales bacterium]